jgi:hypothetical protein
MAPKLSRTMDDPRIPGAGGGAPVTPIPTGAATAMPQGLLNNGPPLVPGATGKTSTIGDAMIHTGSPRSNP